MTKKEFLDTLKDVEMDAKIRVSLQGQQLCDIDGVEIMGDEISNEDAENGACEGDVIITVVDQSYIKSHHKK